jgi:pimeloyl-ACP methyl ester carboxylesterase
LERYDYDIKDKIRIVSQKWGGRIIDKGKELFDFPHVNKLIGLKFDDLADYYESEDIKNKIRLKLSTLLKEHKEKNIILIAHSIGSIIAYDVLRLLEDSEDLQIASFITIGFPVGLPIVVKNIKKEFGDKRTPKMYKSGQILQIRMIKLRLIVVYLMNISLTMA